jgi:hypothetical protein
MAYNTIKIKKYLDIIEEYDAVAAITPGMLVELTSAGKVQAHSVAEGNVVPMFALENELEGDDIDDAYEADDKVQVWIPQRGEEVYAILADGNDVSIGDFLESDGNGYLQLHVADTWVESNTGTVYSMAIVAQALEAVGTGGSSGEESSLTLGYARRIRVRIV